MHGLVYAFIGLASFAVAAATYLGLTFTPIEAGLAGGVALALALFFLERTLRHRAESRMQNAIEDLSRLVTTSAQAGQVLGQRVNTLVDVNAETRLDAVEADLSVLGTVMRQIAEAVAELEEAQKDAAPPTATPDPPAGSGSSAEPDPVIPLEMLRQAIKNDRMLFHLQPIVSLPQRRSTAYDLIPRLLLEDGELADPPDFMPRRGGANLVRRIERMACGEAIAIARRARTAGESITLAVALGQKLLSDASAVDELTALFEANRAVAPQITLAMTENDWRSLNKNTAGALAIMTAKGAGVTITDAKSLRYDYADLAAQNVRSIRTTATRFIDNPQGLSDFHRADLVDYLHRFGIDLVITGINNEQQVLDILEDGVRFAKGPHIGRPAPARPDLLAAPSAPLAPRAALSKT